MILNLFILSLAVQFLFFIPAYAFETDKFTDLSYGLSFIILAYFTYTLGGFTFEKLILLTMVAVWGGRLAFYLVKRIFKIGRDKRFDGTRENFVKFLEFWIFQGVVVPIIILPTAFFMVSQTKISAFVFIGFFVWAIGILFEGFSDAQKYNFINNPKNKGKWVNVGLWRYSRHPNYFGEILCWLGIYIYTFLPLNVSERVIGLLSPITISVLLIFVSGIPILEKKADEKWGKNKEYNLYKRKTSVLVPFFKKYK